MSFDEIVELIHREMYVRKGVMLGSKAAAKAILQAEEVSQHSVRPTVLTQCPYCNREHDSRVACPEYIAKSQIG